MKQRVASVLDHPLRDWGRLDQPFPTICTFHSLCLRILKHYAQRVGLPNNFSVFDSADQTKLLKQIILDMELPSTQYSPAAVHAVISKAKNKLKTVSDFTAEARDLFERGVARVYAKYQEALKANNALDFDDLLLQACRALKAHRDVLEELQDR